MYQPFEQQIAAGSRKGSPPLPCCWPRAVPPLRERISDCGCCGNVPGAVWCLFTGKRCCIGSWHSRPSSLFWQSTAMMPANLRKRCWSSSSAAARKAAAFPMRSGCFWGILPRMCWPLPRTRAGTASSAATGRSTTISKGRKKPSHGLTAAGTAFAAAWIRDGRCSSCSAAGRPSDRIFTFTDTA